MGTLPRKTGSLRGQVPASLALECLGDLYETANHVKTFSG